MLNQIVLIGRLTSKPIKNDSEDFVKITLSVPRPYKQDLIRMKKESMNQIILKL